MDTKDLILEIGTEEIPARFIQKALEDLYLYTKQEFELAYIEHEEIKVQSTPRRFLIYIKDVAIIQKDREERVKGPAKSKSFDVNGNATKAAEGFAKSQGLHVCDLKVELINNTEYLMAVTSQSGLETKEILPEILERIIKSLSFPKSMYWENNNVRFARPVRWLLALFGSDIINIRFGNVLSNRITRGHRFMGSSKIEIFTTDEYFDELKRNFVIIDPEERKRKIFTGIKSIEKELDVKVDIEENLLKEVIHLNEYPIAFYGSFNKTFLEIPEEVLILTMAKNQRYFPVRDFDGNLLPYFVGVSNNLAVNMDVVKEGNERVLSARLYDAAFFWNEDRKRTLEEMTNDLKNIIYQEQLGSLYEKVQRIRKLSSVLTEKLGKNKILPMIDRAASISKADISSSMVYEFPEVQGIMGREYAKKAGEDKRVSLAMYEQYLPRFSGDEIPTDDIGAIIGLAERIDTITSIFKIGQEPTSTQDPYALRRAARCINEIIWGLFYDIDLRYLVETSAALFVLESKRIEQVLSFLNTRIEVQLLERNFDRNVVLLALQTVPYRPLQILRLAETLQKVCKEDWFADLIIAAVRVKNLLTKATREFNEVDPQKFLNDSEKKLNDELEYLTTIAKDAIKASDWEKLSLTLAKLAPLISRFFEDVLVMDKNLEIRNNRLALLAKCELFFMQIGDFSLLK